MKKQLLTFLFFSLVINTIHAQRTPKPPKADAIGKESLWETFESKDAYDILVRTKKIAVLPASSAYFAKKVDPDSAIKIQQNLASYSTYIQKFYFDVLTQVPLSAVLQNPKETNEILKEKGLLNLEALNKAPKNSVCALLVVDAVMYIDITLEHLRSAFAQAALNSLSVLADAASYEVAIGLRMYEKTKGDFFWANSSSEKINSKQTLEKAWQTLINSSFKSIPFIVLK